MLHLLELLHDNVVHLNVSCATQEDVLGWIASFFSKQTAFEKKGIYDHFLKREALGSTALGCGVAIPHARMKGIAQASVVYIRTEHPVEYDAPDGDAVSHFFALVVPEQATDKHLEILSEIVQCFASPEMRRFLDEENDPALVLQSLRLGQGLSDSSRLGV